MKKKLCGILVVLVLSSCGLKPEAPQDFGDPVPSGPRSMAESAKDNVGLVMQSELGEMTIVAQGKGLGIQGETGPLRYELTDYQISSLDTSQYGKDQLASDRDQLTVLTIALYLKNEAATPLVIFPDQGRLQTGSETKVASAIKTDAIGGTLAGQEETAGLITFYLERPAEEIASFTYHMAGPVNEAQEILGEDVAISIQVS